MPAPARPRAASSNAMRRRRDADTRKITWFTATERNAARGLVVRPRSSAFSGRSEPLKTKSLHKLNEVALAPAVARCFRTGPRRCLRAFPRRKPKRWHAGARGRSRRRRAPRPSRSCVGRRCHHRTTQTSEALRRRGPRRRRDPTATSIRYQRRGGRWALRYELDTKKSSKTASFFVVECMPEFSEERASDVKERL